MGNDDSYSDHKFSGKVWPKLSNFFVTRYVYVVSLEPG